MPAPRRFKPGELQTILQSMQEYPPAQVEKDYRTGVITLKDKIHFLSLYGQAQREAAVMGAEQAAEAKTGEVKKLGGGGYIGAATGEAKFYAQNVMREFKAAWDAANAEGGGKKAEAVFHGMMGALKTLDAYNIPGDVAERWALETFPESPGFARAVNWAVWIPTNFFGISALLKAPFKAAQGGAKATVAAGAKIADEIAFIKNPVEYAVKQAAGVEAKTAAKLARESAEGTVKKAAGVAGAAIEAEAKGGKQAFQIAKPEMRQGLEGFVDEMATPQDLEAMTVTNLIKHYQQRSEKMIRSSTEPFNYGGVSHKQTQAAASAKPINFDEIAARGPDAPISASELESIGRVHKEVSDHFNAVVDEAAEHLDEIRAGTRPDLVQSYKAHLAAMEVTNPAFLSARGQTGRGLEYMKTMQDLVRESTTFDVINRSMASDKMLEGNNTAIAYAINRVAQLSKTERAKLLAEASPEKSPSTLRLFYKSLLFANPGTHVANLTGNTGHILLYGVNKTASSLMPFGDTSMAEAAAYWSGLFDSRKKYLSIWQKAQENANKSLAKAGLEGSVSGNLVKRGPLGWLGFEDEVMAGVVQNGLAKGQAVREGLSKWDELQAAAKAGAFEFPAGTNKKKWLGEFVDEAMNNPKTYERLTSEVEKEADYILFRSPLSEAGEDVARGIRKGALDYYLPVLKFPINAMKTARDWTPGLNMISKEFVEAVAAGGARADAARARMTLSWMIGSQIFEAAKMGYITGGGPTDPKANAAWRAAGNTPYAIHGVPIRWAEPFGTVIGFWADLAHISQEMEPDKFEGAATALLLSLYRGVENNYWLRISEGLTNAVSDVKNIGDFQDNMFAIAKVLGQPLKTLSVVGSGVGRRVAEMVNPEVGDMRSYGELEDLKQYFFAGTLFGKDGRPRLNYSGQPQIIPPVMGAKWLEENLGLPEGVARGLSLFSPPTRVNQPGQDRVAEFLNKHELTLHNNWKYYGGQSDPDSPVEIMKGKPRVNLSGDEAYDWEFLAKNDARQFGTNRTWNEAIEALDADPRFNAQTRDEKQKELNQLYIEFRENGKELLRKANPKIREKELIRDQMEAANEPNPGIIPGLSRGIFGGDQPAVTQTPEAEAIPTPIESPAPAAGE